jgi:hypothetical protein
MGREQRFAELLVALLKRHLRRRRILFRKTASDLEGSRPLAGMTTASRGVEPMTESQ